MPVQTPTPSDRSSSNRLTPEQWARAVEGAKRAIALNQEQCPPPVPRTAEEEALLRLD